MSAELCKLPPLGDAPLRKLVAYLLHLKWRAFVTTCEDALLKRLTARALKLNDRRSLKSRLWDARPWGWKTVRETGERRSSSSLCTRYQVHPSGRRRAVQTGEGHQPIDRQWVEGGKWSGPPVPPRGPSTRRAPASKNVIEARAIAARTITSAQGQSVKSLCANVNAAKQSVIPAKQAERTIAAKDKIVGGSGMTRQVVDQMNEWQARGAALRKAKARAGMHEEHACD